MAMVITWRTMQKSPVRGSASENLDIGNTSNYGKSEQI